MGTRTALAVLVCVPLLSACADAQPRDEDARMAGVCQVKRCLCRPKPWSGIGGADAGVSWAADGTPYCADGYRLLLRETAPPR